MVNTITICCYQKRGIAINVYVIVRSVKCGRLGNFCACSNRRLIGLLWGYTLVNGILGSFWSSATALFFFQYVFHGVVKTLLAFSSIITAPLSCVRRPSSLVVPENRWLASIWILIYPPEHIKLTLSTLMMKVQTMVFPTISMNHRYYHQRPKLILMALHNMLAMNLKSDFDISEHVWEGTIYLWLGTNITDNWIAGNTSVIMKLSLWNEASNGTNEFKPNEWS